MTTITCYHKKSPAAIWALLIIAAAIAYGVHYNTHAEQRHGEQAWQVRQSVQCGKDYRQYYDNWTGATVCCVQLDDCKVGISIFRQVGDEWEEITSFVSKSWKYVERMIKIGRWQ